MASPPRSTKPVDWAALAERQLFAGDVKGALVAFQEARKKDRRNGALAVQIARLHERLGNIGEAASELIDLLASKPDQAEARQRLSRLAARFVIPDPGTLSAKGLRAALVPDDNVDVQPICDLALRHLMADGGTLAPLLARLRNDGERDALATEAGRALLERRDGGAYRDDLLLGVLETGLVRAPDVERLLRAARQTLVAEFTTEQAAEKSVLTFIIAMVRQLRQNEYVWSETPAEAAALSGLPFDEARLREGDLASAVTLARRLLCRPLEAIAPALLEPSGLDRIKPRAVRDLLSEISIEVRELREAERGIAAFGTRADATSQAVRRQYEANPYPRWHTLHRSTAGAYKAALTRFFAPDRLSFMDQPFDVLIAGCGTGQQVLQTATALGPNARILAIDLSAASLGFAKRMAKRHAIENVTFEAGDILEIGATGRRFDLIECVGVLHHMADPFAGWRALLDVLAPKGILQIGLYSARARRDIAALRAAADYPGPGVDDIGLRRYRDQLLALRPGEQGASLRASQDFYTTSTFRDLALHVCEHRLDLAQIQAFLAGQHLRFGGFILDPVRLDTFGRLFPSAVWPGTLEDWSRFEADHPDTFEAMYRFWCERI